MDGRLGLIYERRSIRRYTDRDVPEELVEEVLQSAMAAPSACCKDPWEFVVVRDPQRRARIAAGLPNGGMLAHAPLGIVVCGNLQRANAGELSYMLQDCSAAIENLLLACHGLGLGACWLGVHPRPDRIELVTRELGLPEHIVPVSVVAVGWPGETKEARTRYTETCVHRETW